ncbi:zinc finger protein 814-like isoform X2 [Hyperolius riggenbachi]|uniref:zinc finger protein 814-like isoform X2 n=1 Tax=Hyperolius riggenbachi TaxID=752182 RepID=UPI0035A34C69
MLFFQAEVTFDDVAIYFTEEEWDILLEDQKTLYKEVMNNNYKMILSLNQPDIISNIELGNEPYIPSPRSRDCFPGECPATSSMYTGGGSWQSKMARSDRAVWQESNPDMMVVTSPESEVQLKRPRRYPRVNPIRWIKKSKKSKRRSNRISRRSEHREDMLSTDGRYNASSEERDSSHCEENVTAAGDSSGDLPVPQINKEDSSTMVEANDRAVEPCRAHNEDPQRKSTNDHCTQTLHREFESKPDPVMTISTFEDSVSAAENNEETATQSQDKRHTKEPTTATEMPDAAPSKHSTDCIVEKNDGQTQSSPNAVDPSPQPVESASVLKEVQKLDPPNGEKHPEPVPEANGTSSGCGEMTSPHSKEKHVKFSDKITTYMIEPRAEEGIRLRSKSLPPFMNVYHARKMRSLVTPEKENKYSMLKLNFRPGSRKLARKRSVLHPQLGEKSQGAKSQTSVKGTRKTEDREKGEDSEGDSQQNMDSSAAKDPKQSFLLKESLLKVQPYCVLEKIDAEAHGGLHNKEDNKQQENENQENLASQLLHLTPDGQNLIKSYSCSNCGKYTHWTRLNDQQKINVENSLPHMCKKCTQEKDKHHTEASPDKGNGVQRPPSIQCAESCTTPGDLSRRRPLDYLPESADRTQTPKKKEDKGVKDEKVSPRSSNSENHRVHLKENATNQSEMFSEPNNAEKKSNLCSHCSHSHSLDDPELQDRLRAVNGTPPRRTSTSAVSDMDNKRETPETRKCYKVVQSGDSAVHGQSVDSAVQDQKHSTGSKSIERNKQAENRTPGGSKSKACTNCGKQFTNGQKGTPLTSLQHKKAVKSGLIASSDNLKKLRTKSIKTINKKLDMKMSYKHKVKRLQNEDLRDPKLPKKSRNKDEMCTKCGKRMELHVMPSQEDLGEGGNDENKCILLARKKRKRPLEGMEPFQCEECGKIFTRHFTLLQHRMIHTGERPHTCTVCGKTFRDGGYLGVHMRSHTKEKPYVCTECGKCFSQSSALGVHLRTHTDERPFRCKVCDKSFSDRSTHRHHQRIHTGEKPYACSFCGKKFTQQPHMKRHEAIHTGDRPFKCLLCGKRFLDRTKLKKHGLVHEKRGECKEEEEELVPKRQKV